MLKWVWSIEDPKTDEDERLLLDSVGVLNRGIVSAQGRITLTTKRIIFLPSHLRFMPKWLLFGFGSMDIPLDEVQKVAPDSLRHRLLGGLPGFPAFAVYLRDGKRYVFQTVRGALWRAEIEKLIR